MLHDPVIWCAACKAEFPPTIREAFVICPACHRDTLLGPSMPPWRRPPVRPPWPQPPKAA